MRHLYEPLTTSVTAAQQAATTPTRNGTTTPLTISTRWLYTHITPGTEAESNYTRMNGGNNAPAGFGFTMKGVDDGTSPVPGHDQTYEFRGRPNNGDFTITVGNTLMTLSGNPYPSALDLNQVFNYPPNTALGTFWYYDENRTVYSHYYSQKPFGYGTYSVGLPDTDGNMNDNNPPGIYTTAPFYIWNSGGTHGGQTGTSANSDGNKRYAPIGQGIMFVGDGDGPVTIKNEHRLFYKEGDPGSVFQRPGVDNGNQTTTNSATSDPSTASETLDYRAPQMRIWTIFDEAVTRDMVIAFYDQATDGYDRGLDGLSPQNLKTDAYFPVATHTDSNILPYVINGVNYDYGKQIPIVFKLKNQTKFEVKAVEEVKKPYEQAYLFDRQQQTYQQITDGQSATFNLPAGKYENRFYVVFRAPREKDAGTEAQTALDNLVRKSVTFFQNNSQKQLEVKNPDGYTLISAAVYDMGGKLVIQEKNLGDDSSYSFYTGNLSDGVYLVNLVTSEGITIDYKAIVHNQ